MGTLLIICPDMGIVKSDFLKMGIFLLTVDKMCIIIKFRKVVFAVYTHLKELRESLGMTQAEFGKSIGIAKSTYNNYEKGIREPKSDFWVAVATKYRVTIDYLMGYSDDPHSVGAGAEKPTLISEGEPVLPPEYKFLNPANKAIVDRLIADLVKGQPAGPKLKIYAAALDGGRYETEADADITLPESVQALPDEYEGKGTTPPSDAPEAPPEGE